MLTLMSHTVLSNGTHIVEHVHKGEEEGRGK